MQHSLKADGASLRVRLYNDCIFLITVVLVVVIDRKQFFVSFINA